jgi:hypothetical protein
MSDLSFSSTPVFYSMPGKKISNDVPKNWPAHLPYLKSPSYSPSLTSAQRAGLRIKQEDAVSIPPNTPRGPSSLVKITDIKDPSHPAYGQAGLFAAKDLKPGSFIIEYLGIIHSSPPPPIISPLSPSTPIPSSITPNLNTPPQEPKPNPTPTQDPHASSNYDLSLDRTLSLAIDAATSGNEARFINDYRGIAERPNAEFREVWNEARRERGMGVWVSGVGKSGKFKGVRKGEEIVVSYGRGFWGARRGEGVGGGDG